ncbi:MAG: tetratricopeptide repeat protein [Euryarchaeota archaeon]|nr:tetratricopeptide repeat protein [Euryarchaeota archaeon]
MTQEADKEKILREFMTLPGIGISKAKALYDAGFMSLDALGKAGVQDITKCKGFNEKLAKEIVAHITPAGQPAAPQSNEEKYVQAALSLYKDGKWGQALQEVEGALKENPKSDRAVLVKGDIYFERERYDRAEEAYRRLVEIVPESDMALLKLGDALAKQGRKFESEECYKKALALNPRNDEATERLESERLKTYVRGLDERMDGGIPARYVVLVAGRAGSMKSSLVFNILYNLSRHERKKAVYITLEQSRKSLLRHMVRLGFDPTSTKEMVISDLDDLVIIDMAKLRKETGLGSASGVDWASSLLTQVKNYKESFGCDVLAIDSMSALYSLMEFKNPRAELFFFFERLRDLGITVFLVTEMLSPEKDIYGQYGVEEFLADGIIHLKTEKYGNKANLFLGVVKMRETKHERDYFPLIVDKDGFEIVAD